MRIKVKAGTLKKIELKNEAVKQRRKREQAREQLEVGDDNNNAIEENAINEQQQEYTNDIP